MNKLRISRQMRIASLVCFATLTLSQLSLQAAPPELSHQNLDQFINSSGQAQKIKTVKDWEARKQQLLKNMQEVMGSLPPASAEPVKYQVTESLSGEGFLRQTITFAAEPGAPVVADLYLPHSIPASEKRAGIVALHPTGPLGKRIVAGDSQLMNRQYGKELAQRGYVVICPDYPSFGDAADYDFSTDDYVSGTMKGIVNHRRCVDLLQSLTAVDPEKIGVIGHSLGGHNAMFLGIFDERVQVIISSCGWTPFHDYKEGNITGWTSDRYMPRLKTEYDLDPDKVPFDFPEIVAGLAPRHFYSSSPENDSNFDMAGVQKGIKEAQKIFDLYRVSENLKVVYPKCEHDFPTEIRREAYQLLDRVFAHKPVQELGYAAELPRLAALSPQEALDAFQVAEGMTIEQTAAEPLVVDPVAMCFDEDGRLFVIEMRDYSEDDALSLGRVRLLEDLDKDGKFDKSTVYAEGFSWPTAVTCYDGGVFVGAAPNIYYLKDTNGDGQADEKKTVFTGFGKKNVQALLNSFRWGLDNRIYGATSANGGLVRRPEQPESEALNLSGRNFSFDPVTLELRAESGAAQHGMGFDDWGRMFVCSNGDHFQMVMYQDRYAARNPYLKAPSARSMVAEDGPQAEVFRISPVEPWRIVRTRLRASGRVKGAVEWGGKNSGYFTSATGVNFYRGDAWEAADKGTAIVGDVGSNIVHRKRVLADGVQMKGSRIDQNSELVSSKDTWFRPVQYENGPDGALHILDMYRETIEHPWSLPPEIKQHLDLTSGRDRGRLYRLVPEGYEHRPCPELSKFSSAELAQLLTHPNSWHREVASRLLFERQDTSVAPLLKQLAAESSEPLGRMHALYTLLGLHQLDAETVSARLTDEHPMVRMHAVLLSEQFLQNDSVRKALTKLVTDPSTQVRYQLAFTLGQFPDDWNATPLVRLIAQDGGSSWLRFAAFSSLENQMGTVLQQLATQQEFLSQPFAQSVLTQLVEMIARRANPADVAVFATLLSTNDQLSETQKQNLFQTFATNTSRAKQSANTLASLEEWRLEFVKSARSKVQNEKLSDKVRVAAIQSLTVSQDQEDVDLLFEMLSNQQPESVQLAALESLVVLQGQGTDSYLIEAWPTLSPKLRKEAQAALLGRAAWATTFLQAVLAEKVPRADVDRPQLQVLRNSQSSQVKELCDQVIAQLQVSPRGEVIEKYRPVLEQEGNLNLGRALFTKHCASCHQLEGQGKPIGPNLATYKNRGKEAILINVLDPSREVTPDYINYLVVTIEGRSYTGLLASQNATTITLQRAEGEPITILRGDIEDMRSSGISLMPEGLEKELDQKAMADLLTYLMQVE